MTRLHAFTRLQVALALLPLLSIYLIFRDEHLGFGVALLAQWFLWSALRRIERGQDLIRVEEGRA